MPRLTAWRWWAGNANSVDEDGVFDLAQEGTREAVIRSAALSLRVGEVFYIIEARHWERAREPVDGVDRFARFKNRERLVMGDAACVAAGAR
ncbi:hypothetical protein [Sphingomonas sp. SRS2]|uniref:hypothetical protein n=1 Tax=Sphingomonas sp. SRS2 TaxID=133190 RepID=UPI000B326B42|nr:hypothetical protein [Sphingomonas sp. SRS2]